MKSQQKKPSPNTGEKKQVQYKSNTGSIEPKPSKKSVHKLSGCKCLAGVPLKYCLGYKKPEHATLDYPCACKCHRNGDEDPCEKCEPSQQEYRMTEVCPKCHKPLSTKITTEAQEYEEMINNRELHVTPLCKDCQPPKSSDLTVEASEWEEQFRKDYGFMRYDEKSVKEMSELGMWDIVYENIKFFIKKALSQQQKEVEERVRRETIDKAFDWIWDGWNLNLANKDRAKEQFLTSIEEKGGKQ